MIGLRVQRGASSLWLTAFNLLFAAVVLVPLVWRMPVPSGRQMAVLFLYGAGQMTLPYWLVAHSLRRISPQEVGTITLLEPLLNPVWAYIVSPATEGVQPATLAGGACILAALVWRYWPLRRETAKA
jgi:DME family drug/metabolite transporter